MTPAFAPFAFEVRVGATVTPACAPSSVAVAVSGCSPYAIGGWDGKNSTPCAAGNGASGAPSCRWGCGTHSRHGRRFASAYMGPRASAAGSSRGRWHRGTRRLLRRGLTSQQLHHLLKSRPRLSIVAGVLPHRAYCAARSSHWPRNDRAGRVCCLPVRVSPHFGAVFVRRAGRFGHVRLVTWRKCNLSSLFFRDFDLESSSSECQSRQSHQSASHDWHSDDDDSGW